MKNSKLNDSNYTIPSDDLVKQAEEKLSKEQEEKTNPNKLSFNELGAIFDQQYEMSIKLLSSLSKNSLIRVFKKYLAWPLRDDEISLVGKDEKLPYEIVAHVQQLKIAMLMEDLRMSHEKLAEKMKENYKVTEEFEEKLKNESDT